MAKYLHYCSIDYDDFRLLPKQDYQHLAHLVCMFNYYSCPFQTNGIGKVNVLFNTKDAGGIEVCLGIAEVKVRFALDHFLSRSPLDQQRYYLERLCEGLVSCAQHYGWDPLHFPQALARMYADQLQFVVPFQKPKFNKSRTIKAQIIFEVAASGGNYVVFFDRQMSVLQRVFLQHNEGYLPEPHKVYSPIKWVDEETVKVQHFDRHDSYWLVNTHGGNEHYDSRATKDAHGEYQLGLIYASGNYGSQYVGKGLELIRSAARQGYRHAIRHLEHMGHNLTSNSTN